MKACSAAWRRRRFWHGD